MLKGIEPIEPRSAKGIIDFLRILMSIAFKEKIVYIDIAYKTSTDKKLQGFSSDDLKS